MPIPAVLAAAIPSVIAGVGSLLGGRQANKARKDESGTNRKFQERMRNTQWQSAVADMEKAGINPALAYSKGPNAAPSGSMAQQQDAVSPAISSAMQMRRVTADLGLIQAQTAKATGEAMSASAKGNLDAARQEWMQKITGSGRPGDAYSIAQNRMMADEVAQSRAGVGRTRASTRESQLKGDVLEPMAEIAKQLGIALPVLMMMTKGLPGGVVGAARGVARRANVGRIIRKVDRARRGGR